jgi:molybdopterin-guanine dinucleotide biosynthesis protein A
LRLSHIEGAVLVGGASTRMGRDKATLPVQGIAMAERVARVLASCLERVTIIGRPDTPPLAGFPFVADTHAQRAPIVGLCAALRAARTSAVLVAACDLPDIDPAIALALLALAPAGGGAEIVAFTGSDGPEPLLAIYRTSLVPDIESRIAAGRLALRDLVRAHRAALLPLELARSADPQLRSFRNVNRPQDLTAADRAAAP